MARKAAYVEDCPEEDNGDAEFIIPPSQKKVNFAVKLPQNRENNSTLDSGYQSLTGEKNRHQPKSLGKENNASHRVEIKIENNGKKLRRERSFKDSGATKKHTKEKARLYPVQDGPRLSMPGSGPPRVTINDTRFRKDNGNLRGYHSPCECQGCQEVLFSQATTAQQPSYIPRPQSQSTFRLPSMIQENLPNSKFIHVNRSNRPRPPEKDNAFRARHTEPRVRSTPYEKFSPSNFETDEHGNQSYIRSGSSKEQYYPKGNFYSSSPMYLNVAQPIDSFDTPSYQLPSYTGPQSFSVPLSPTVLEQQSNYDAQNIYPWWPPNRTLPENNWYLLDPGLGAYSPGWDMQREPKHQVPTYLPSHYSTQNNYPIYPTSVPHISLNTPATFLHNQYNASHTIDNTDANPSRLPSYPPIRSQTAASFISTKDQAHRDISSRFAKTQGRVSIKQEKNRQFKESSEHPLREKPSVNQQKEINTTKLPQNITESNDRKRYHQPGQVNSYAEHKTSAYKPSQNSSGYHTLDRRRHSIKNNGGSVRPHPLTKDALEKLNKEHGDDIDSKAQGMCRANSSRSTIFDEGNATTVNKGTRGKF